MVRVDLERRVVEGDEIGAGGEIDEFGVQGERGVLEIAGNFTELEENRFRGCYIEMGVGVELKKFVVI